MMKELPGMAQSVKTVKQTADVVCFLCKRSIKNLRSSKPEVFLSKVNQKSSDHYTLYRKRLGKSGLYWLA